MSDWCSGERCNKCQPLPGCWHMKDSARLVRLTNLLKAAHIALRYHTEQTRPIQNTNAVIGAIDAEFQGPNAEFTGGPPGPSGGMPGSAPTEG